MPRYSLTVTEGLLYGIPREVGQYAGFAINGFLLNVESVVYQSGSWKNFLRLLLSDTMALNLDDI
jgi:hypothetical protein